MDHVLQNGWGAQAEGSVPAGPGIGNLAFNAAMMAGCFMPLMVAAASLLVMMPRSGELDAQLMLMLPVMFFGGGSLITLGVMVVGASFLVCRTWPDHARGMTLWVGLVISVMSMLPIFGLRRESLGMWTVLLCGVSLWVMCMRLDARPAPGILAWIAIFIPLVLVIGLGIAGMVSDLKDVCRPRCRLVMESVTPARMEAPAVAVGWNPGREA